MLLYRTLDGDKSDNIPGIKGCGIKTILKRFPELSEDSLGNFVFDGVLNFFLFSVKNMLGNQCV